MGEKVYIDERIKCAGMCLFIHGVQKLYWFSFQENLMLIAMCCVCMLCYAAAHGNDSCLQGLQLEHSELLEQFKSDICSLAC